MPSEDLRILLVTPFFAPQTGGVATYLEDLRRDLCARGHSVYVLRFGNSDTIELCPQCNDERVFEFFLREIVPKQAPIKGLFAFFVYLIPTLWRLRRFLLDKRISLVCLEYPLPFVLYFTLLQRWMGFRVLVGLHGDDVLSLHFLRGYEQVLVRWIVRRADWILAHSSSLLEQANAILGDLGPNVSYLHYGVGCDLLRDLARRKSVLSPLLGRSFIFTAAKLYDRKGIDVLLRAIALLQDRAGKPPLFAIAGDGPERGALERLTVELQIKERVLFLGDVEYTAVPALMKACEFFVLPSRSEPFGIVLVEAMALGKAIIASRVGGIPEFVKDGETGFLVPPGNPEALAAAILRLLEDTSLRERFQDQGLRISQNFDQTQVILRYEELFQRVMRL